MDIQESLELILEREDPFASLFYAVFLDQYPEVRPFFARVDLKRQAVLLTTALQFVVQYHVHSFPVIEAYLKVLGEKHCEWGIGAEHYSNFCTAMLATLGQFHGSAWNEQLAQQWQRALERASKKMLEDYTHSR